MLSLLLAALDSYTDHLRLVRSSLWQIVSPLYYVAEAPYSISSDLKQTFISRQELLAQLERQRVELLALSHTAQRYQSLKADNDRMRKLLESKAKLPGSVLIAEIVSVRATPSAHYVVIDKGAVDGLQVGQAVLDAQGLFGQLVEVGSTTSRVLLIIDKDHAVPVQVNRNGAHRYRRRHRFKRQFSARKCPGFYGHCSRRLIGNIWSRRAFPSGLPRRRGDIGGVRRQLSFCSSPGAAFGANQPVAVFVGGICCVGYRF